MIDLQSEKLLALTAVPAYLGRRGVAVSPRTVRDWPAQGLETVKLGRRRYTSREALQRFAAGREARKREERPETARQRQRREKADDDLGRRLKAVGW